MIIDVHVHSGEKHHFSEEMDVTLDKGLHVAGWEAKGLWKDTGIFDVGVDGLIERMDQAGVDKAFLFAMDLNYVWKSHVPNEYVAKIVDKHPDRFIGFSSVDPLKGMQAVDDLEIAINDLKMQGLKMYPGYGDFSPNDATVYPVYEKAQELGIPVVLHSGWISAGKWKKIVPLTPKYDEVAVDFPDLKIILAHGGHVLIDEVLMLMLKNPNIYIDLSWWSFLMPVEYQIKALKLAKHFMVLDKVLWGTDNYDPRIDIALVKSLPEKSKEYNLFPTLPEINNEDIENYLGNNAAKLMGI